MKVHAHSNTLRKKWTHYLFEFFMLFLAVFCGFLAESLRESQVLKHTAGKYVESFYEDLKTDTARMNFYTDFDDAKLAALKNLNNCL